jgi:hypothetical protein
VIFITFCSKCGNELSQGAEFCSKCGNHMGSTPVEPKTVEQKVEYKPVASPKIEPQKEQSFDISQLSALTLIYAVILGALSIIGSFGIAIIGILIWYFLAGHAINTMTYKVKGSVNWAFAIIFTFGIIGYVCYWIWYLNKKDHINQ